MKRICRLPMHILQKASWGSIIGEDKLNKDTYTYTYDYDDTYLRPIEVIETQPEARFTQEISYDTYGRPATEINRSKYFLDGTEAVTQMTYGYDTVSGALLTLTDADGRTHYTLKEQNARGQMTLAELGTGKMEHSYDAYGLPKARKHTQFNSSSGPTTVLDVQYSFNAVRGILESRNRNGRFSNAITETFTHDIQDRLTEVEGLWNLSRTYDKRGRVQENSNLGKLEYQTDKVYQLREVNLNAEGVTKLAGKGIQELTYNMHKNPVRIFQEGGSRVDFTYSPLGGRSQVWYGGGATAREDRRYHKVYSAILPIEIISDTQTRNTKILSYKGGDAYSADIVQVTQSKPATGDPSSIYLYINRDYLGSILSIASNNGSILEETYIGAWGQINAFVTGGYAVSDEPELNAVFDHNSLLGRGYTGHEHFFEVSLIHMNGRMYDAELGRFLSPDNFIQDPYNTQNFDRYGYVLNNPLVISDPNGEFFIAAVAIGAAIGGLTSALQGGNFGDILLGTLIGGIAGGVGAGVGNVVAGGAFFSGQAISTTGFVAGFTSGFSGGFAGGFTGSTLTSLASGDSFGDSLAAGLSTGITASASGGITNGIISGFRAKANGLKFSNGKSNGFATIPKGNKISGSLINGQGSNPSVALEGNFMEWTGTAPGPDGGSVYRTGNASREFTLRYSRTRIDWKITFKVNGTEIGQNLQMVGDGMAYAGYGLTLTGAGASFGVPIAGIGNGISFGGSLLESAATTNWQQGGTAIGGFGLNLGTDAIINRVPGLTPVTRNIIKQNVSLKLKWIENSYNNGN